METKPDSMPTLADPELEGFSLETVELGDEALARAVADEVLGTDWNVIPYGDRGTDYEVTPRGAAELSVAEAWQKAYELRSRPGIVSAEPVFAVYAPVENDEPETELESLVGGTH